MAAIDLGIPGVESEQTAAIGIDTGKMLEDQREINAKTKMTWTSRKEAWADRNKNLGLKDPRLRMDDRTIGQVDRRLPAIWCAKGCHYVQNCRIYGGNGQEMRIEDIADVSASVAEATRLGLPMTPEFWKTHRQEVAEMLVTYVAMAKEKSDTLCVYCFMETSSKEDHTTHMIAKHLDRYMMDHGLSPNPPPAAPVSLPSFTTSGNNPAAMNASTFTVAPSPETVTWTPPPVTKTVSGAPTPIVFPGDDRNHYAPRHHKLDVTPTICQECGGEFKGPGAFKRHMTSVKKKGSH